MVSKIGFAILTIGIMSADSDKIIFPLMLVAVGALMTFVGSRWL